MRNSEKPVWSDLVFAEFVELFLYCQVYCCVFVVNGTCGNLFFFVVRDGGKKKKGELLNYAYTFWLCKGSCTSNMYKWQVNTYYSGLF